MRALGSDHGALQVLRGPPSEALVHEGPRADEAVHEPADTLCFVCGPKTLVNESVTTLAALGVPADAIRTEGWVVPRA